MHLVHQEHVELTEERLELFGVWEGLCPQHLLSYDPDHRVLTYNKHQELINIYANQSALINNIMNRNKGCLHVEVQNTHVLLFLI